MKKKIALALCIIMALLLVPTASASVNLPQQFVYELEYSANDYIVTASALRYRDSAGTDGKILGSFYKGTVVPVTGRSSNGKWASVVVGENVVWVYAQYLERAGDPSYETDAIANAKTYVVTAYPYAVVVAYFTDGVETIGKIARGESVEVYEVNDVWGLVNYNGVAAYIQMDNLK